MAKYFIYGNNDRYHNIILGGINMKEKAFKTMGRAGACNIVIGICTLIGGIAAGVLLIVHGGKLLAHRSDLTI